MSDAKADILGGIRRALKREAIAGREAEALDGRLRHPAPNLVPARSRGLDRAALAALFERQAGEVMASIARVPTLAGVPEAIADYLAAHNLPAEIQTAPDPLLDAVPWDRRPLLRVTRGKPDGKEAVGVTPAFAGIAETGTLMLLSGASVPSTLNFLPDTHVVVLPAKRLVGALEDAWQALRLRYRGAMPRTVNLITGPSRTGDIEQRIQMGAHGPRRLHIIVVEDEALD